MKTLPRPVGLDRAMADLAKAVKEIKGRTVQGLIKGMIIVMNDSQKRTPVDTGNLRASHFLMWNDPKKGVGGIGLETTKFSNKKGTMMAVAQSHEETVIEAKRLLNRSGVAIGVGAHYAYYVHEDMQARHRVGEARFLQHALEVNTPLVLGAIRKAVKS